MTPETTALPRTGLVDIPAAAGYFGVHASTVRRWIAKGQLPARRVGPTLIRIRVEDIRAFADGCASVSA
ncbi:hypothetical protein A5634_22305 [Mycobacterium asiaticum]|uniref:Helix-turn-helix domain-containing protein n=1 Tax=Mycobacterium asiaticum TaxID=1790 RepID=A0A1A3P536_MYCAS|nr:helix-turn-helix domain-containing protein [Mycobacterium asiaticum]OBK27702.1 hypothetical protein A5634_22305 [Mycobacterium asiaticum]